MKTSPAPPNSSVAANAAEMADEEKNTVNLDRVLNDPELMGRIGEIVNRIKAGAPLDQMVAEMQKNADPVSEAPANAAPADNIAPPSGSPPPGNATAKDMISSVLSNPEMMAKLPSIMASLGPMLGKSNEKSAAPASKSMSKHAPDKRIALLAALKPYMNPKRCEAIDYIIKLDKIGDLLRSLS